MTRTLIVEDVRHSYDDHVALNGVSFGVDAGEIVALLGMNGAGKSTLIKAASGLIRPTSGTIRIKECEVTAGESPAHLLGIAPQDTSVQLAATVLENLQFYGRLGGLSKAVLRERIDWLVEAMGLTDLVDRMAQKLSGGERRRLHAALAMITRPALILLDEPTVGADIETRANILEVVKQLAEDGTAVLYTTHYLGEVEEIADRAVILHRGEVVADSQLDQLLVDHATPMIELEFAGEVPTPTGLPAESEWSIVEDRLVLTGGSIADLTVNAMNGLGSALDNLTGLTVRPADLGSVFLTLTGDEFVGDSE